jgi:hypothetical protein
MTVKVRPVRSDQSSTWFSSGWSRISRTDKGSERGCVQHRLDGRNRRPLVSRLDVGRSAQTSGDEYEYEYGCREPAAPIARALITNKHGSADRRSWARATKRLLAILCPAGNIAALETSRSSRSTSALRDLPGWMRRITEGPRWDVRNPNHGPSWDATSTDRWPCRCGTSRASNSLSQLGRCGPSECRVAPQEQDYMRLRLARRPSWTSCDGRCSPTSRTGHSVTWRM